MNSKELKRLLAAKGATFETNKSGSGHIRATLNGRTTELPIHGSRKELGTGLVNKIMKDLGLK